MSKWLTQEWLDETCRMAESQPERPGASARMQYVITGGPDGDVKYYWVLENGKLLAVIPGWSDASRGMPGYSRDVVGQTPFGWSLDDAMEGLGPRVERARAYWKWRGHDRSWGVFQQGVQPVRLDHLNVVVEEQQELAVSLSGSLVVE